MLERLWPLVLALNLGIAAALALFMGMFFGDAFANLVAPSAAVPVGVLVGASVLTGGVWLSFRETRRFRERPEDGFLVKPLRYAQDPHTTVDGRLDWSTVVPLIVGSTCLWVALFDGIRIADFKIMSVGELVLRLVFLVVGLAIYAVGAVRFYRPR